MSVKKRNADTLVPLGLQTPYNPKWSHYNSFKLTPGLINSKVWMTFLSQKLKIYNFCCGSVGSNLSPNMEPREGMFFFFKGKVHKLVKVPGNTVF